MAAGPVCYFHEAAQRCVNNGGVLGSPEQMQNAWENGFEYCAMGWMNDGSTRSVHNTHTCALKATRESTSVVLFTSNGFIKWST